MSGPPSIPHRIVRTRNRHSRAVYSGNEIIIRLARNLSAAEEQKHIENLLRRMAKHVELERGKTLIDPFRELLAGAGNATIALAHGTTYDIELSPGRETRVRSGDNGWTITIDPAIRRAQLHSLLWNLLAAREVSWIANVVGDVNLFTFRERLGPVGFGLTSSQWGSCGRNGKIMLNAALLFVPERLLHYVIVHELGHIRFANHSARYWAHIASAMPDYDVQRAALRQFRICRI